MSVGAVNKQTGDRIPTAGMPAIDDALDLTSVNPVQNAVITAALANKQDKTDNNLDTDAKTIVGGINEVKSGLTNYELQNNINLEVPNRKNLAGDPYNVMLNSFGVFFKASVRTYIVPTSYGKITISVDDIAKIADDVIRLGYCNDIPVKDGTGVRINNMETNTYTITPSTTYKYLVVSNLLDDQEGWQDIQIEIGDTATAYTPYIPSVESRIEAVESGLTDMPMKQWQKNTSGSAGIVTFTFSSSVNRYAGLLFCINNSGVSAIFAVAYKEDIEPIITRLAGSDAVTPSISIDGSITVGLYAWSTAILFANGNFV